MTSIKGLTDLAADFARAGAVALALGLVAAQAGAQETQVTAFKQAVAEAAALDKGMAEFYRQRGYAPLWTGEGEEFRARRAALIDALDKVDLQGLPRGRYKLSELMQQMRSARTNRDLGQVEAALTHAFLTYANDVHSGMLVPTSIDPGIVRERPVLDETQVLKDFAQSAPRAFLEALPPHNPEYRNLLKERLRLARVMNSGGWGPEVAAKALKPGDSGPDVIALRNRLIAMGYIERSVAPDYDAELVRGVRAFQEAHGLEVDGVAGPGTITEINVPASERLKSVLVAMERERWMNIPRGRRHVLVNLTDFTSKIVDDGQVTFETKSVVGKNAFDRRSPEFSDLMEHMIVNPSWHVPRSIATKEYLPLLQKNPQAARNFVITDSRGRRVDRETADFTQYTTGNFPFDMRQPPGAGNALGKVKFMFPNKYNIYLHDTPAKSLFKREVRAYSHGCIRLADPFDFAYALLAKQTKDPQSYFQSVLRSGRETKIDLVDPVPVHLIYRTAVISPRGKVGFRRDVYERDAKIWNALHQAGVELGPVQG